MKITIIILLILGGLYCLAFAPFGKHKIYEYEPSESIDLAEGHTFSGLHCDDEGNPYQLMFFYLVSSKEIQPHELIVNDVSLTGAESGTTHRLGSSSSITKQCTDVAFQFSRDQGVKYESYVVKATTVLVFDDGSKKTQEINFPIHTNYREVRNPPWWMGYVF